MKKLMGIVLFGGFLIIANASAQTQQCFESEGLKTKQTVSLVILGGGRIEGSFKTSGNDDGNAEELTGFFGTKKDNLLTISSAEKIPYEVAPKTKKIVWTLGAKTLKIPMYGKNYDTNKFSAYNSTFEKCK